MLFLLQYSSLFMKINIDMDWNDGGISSHIHSTWLIEQWDSKSTKELSSTPAGRLGAVPWGFKDELWSVAGEKELFSKDLQHLDVMPHDDE